MFQNLLHSFGRVQSVLRNKLLSSNSIIQSAQSSKFHSLTKYAISNLPSLSTQPSCLSLDKSPSVLVSQSRSIVKYSKEKGVRLSDESVLNRFYRLNWGMWIHAKCGRHKKMWKKHEKQKRRLRQHVMCNATQCTLLDKMVTNQFKKKKYFVDDPYEPYHEREEFYITSRKPRPLPVEAHSVVDTSP